GKHVVTANKALLARHGIALAGLAEAHGRALNFEAAVAGGIPIIKSLREGFAGNRIHALYGILNGTSNYILSEMRESGGAFADVLKDAQEKGYAEADPSFDIDGIDAAHKLSILSGLAFGVAPDFGAVSVAGIRSVSADDIMFAEELGYRIKLLGIARGAGDGRIEQSIEPCLIPEETPLASVEGVYNAVFAAGDFVGSAMLEGRGAGGGPTASAVAADIVDIARGLVLPAYGVPVAALEEARWAGDEEIECAYYLRLCVTDKPGVVADISAILRDYAISIETMIQTARDPGQPVSLVMTLHECARASMAAAAEKIERLECVAEKPVMLRIERF
ncbi:MAG: homoserine dehydrogenase, partial [Micavibrio sp.]